jgi:hypothetical protein
MVALDGGEKGEWLNFEILCYTYCTASGVLAFLSRKETTMAFSFTNSKGTKYYLHAKTVARKGGTTGKLFYFSKEVKAAEALDAVPAGYKVTEMKTGLPVLKKA